MGKVAKKDNFLPEIPTTKPDKVETYAGKQTARVTKSFDLPDGSVIKATKKSIKMVLFPIKLSTDICKV